MKRLILIASLLGSLACGRAVPSTPLTRAAAEGDLTRVRLLLAQGQDPEDMDGEGWSPLIWAAGEGRLSVIRELLEAGVDPDRRDEGQNQWTAALHAIHHGRIDSLEMLLDGGASADAPADDGLTPLIMAAGYGDAEAVRLLLEHGADPRRQTHSGHDALMAAVGGAPDVERFTVGTCQTETVDLLLGHAPDLRLKRTWQGRVIALVARAGGCSEIVTRAQAETPPEPTLQ